MPPILAIVLAPLLGLAALEPPAEEAAMVEAVVLVNEGDFEAALLKLDEAVRRLQAAPPPQRGLPMAHVYLGICHLELERQAAAKQSFRTAQCLDPALRLDPRSFSPQVLREFAAARDPDCRQVAAAGKGGSGKPLLYVLGGGGAIAGVALAAGGGGGQAGPTAPPTTAPIAGGVTTTTSTTMGTAPSTSPPSTVAPPPSTTSPTPTTTLPRPTTTTVPPTTTTTLPPTTTTTLPPTTTTTLAACSYSLGPDRSFTLLGGSGNCNVTTRPDCTWTATKDVSWITFTGATSGSGSLGIPYQVSPGGGQSRTGHISVGGSSCTITQSLLGTGDPTATVSWTSELTVPGARGQVVVNGAQGAFHEQGAAAHSAPVQAGANRLEAQLVSAMGRPGTWRFEIAGAFEPGSLRVVAGDVLTITDRMVVFRLSGKPGERVVLVFQAP